MKYSELVALYEQLDSTSKRLEKTRFLSEFLRKASAEEIEPVILLVQGRVFPAYDEREIGVANQLVVKAISLASGSPLAAIEREWARSGDLGKVAELLIRTKRQATLSSTELTVKKVFDNLRRLTDLTGSGSVDRKLQLIAELLSSARGVEARYVTRTVLGQLRVGTGAGILRDSIAWAYFPKVAAEVMEQDGKATAEAREEYNELLAKIQAAYDLTNDFAVVARKAKTEGVVGLDKVEVKIGNPIKVMLALKVDTVKEALDAVGRPAQCEYKYDGFRLECHRNGNDFWLYTRRLENVTAQFPEVVDYLKKCVKGDRYILDTEAVGYDPKTRKYVPFQDISQRIKRKYDIERLMMELPVEVNVFDIISHDGKNLTAEPFHKRRLLVESMVRPEPGNLKISTSIVSASESEIEKFFRKAKADGTEGLMIKKLDAPYQPGARVGYMLKYKKVMENLDLVIVAAEWGEGKRAKWLSSYYLACRHDGGKLLEIGKVSTGLKEKREEGFSFDEVTELLRPLIQEQEGRYVKVKPKIILEVAYEEIQKSPTYESGYALRFPRVIRNRTDEKGVDDINTLEDVEGLYQQQKKTKG
ncbi:ATP-dependent DNA ligase [Candidatus Woesearchaeota archaeon]|nr:ATP-dependent DNA ligase [Candidatus Woesearchaeota archaeon]